MFGWPSNDILVLPAFLSVKNVVLLVILSINAKVLPKFVVNVLLPSQLLPHRNVLLFAVRIVLNQLIIIILQTMMLSTFVALPCWTSRNISLWNLLKTALLLITYVFPRNFNVVFNKSVPIYHIQYLFLSPPSSLAILRPNPWTTVHSQATAPQSNALPIQSTPSPPSNFVDIIQSTVKPYEDQLSILATQMSNLTKLSIVHDLKVDYVTSLVKKVMLPSFRLLSDTLPTLLRLLPDSSVSPLQRDELTHQLRFTSFCLQSAYERQQNFRNSLDHTQTWIIDQNVMTHFSTLSLPLTTTSNATTMAISSSTSSSWIIN